MTAAERIAELKARRRALIMAHNYTTADVQEIADFTGDSLELARKAAECKAPVIVLCGVKFMAETAKILSPDSIVLHPAPDAGCPMAEMAPPEEIRQFRRDNPETLLVAYVNTTAAAKSLVDVCCTSGNAEKVVAALPADKEIMFLPDANLGANLVKKLARPMRLWHGCCPIHDRITPQDIRSARAAHPDAVVMVHPECRPEVIALADHALSTGGMLKMASGSSAREFIVGTEIGILHRMRKENPGKVFHPLDVNPLCEDMKKVTLEKIAESLEKLSPRIELDAETIRKARGSIEKMLELSR